MHGWCLATYGIPPREGVRVEAGARNVYAAVSNSSNPPPAMTLGLVDVRTWRDLRPYCQQATPFPVRNGTPLTISSHPKEPYAMDMRLELVPLPTTDVDRSKEFYVDRVGFNLDHDVQPGNGLRVVQLTPPGSACSIVVGVGISDPDAPRVLNLHLVVADVEEARARLSSKDVDVSEVSDMGGVKYAYFSDPDGNSWALQQLPR